jgi:hypothetical protein
MTVDYEKLGMFYLGREFDAGSNALKDDLVLYDSRDLTTHAVCVGMTGSGKTGLCLSLLEEAAIDGVPAICIDPKGDLGNLLLAFPQLQGADFQPWVDSAEAARKGMTVEAFAAKTAETWKNGLSEWQQAPERIAKFKDSVDVAIYTPGARTGLPLSVLRSFAAPPADALADSAAVRERASAVVSGLLSLLGRDADPLQSREHILLATIVETAWNSGQNLDMAALINAIQKPAFDRIGAFDLDTFFAPKDRLQLAMAINNLLASPSFAAWMEGAPLDAQRLLFTPEGKPRISIISIAHLSDPERMFIVTLVLNELIAWMRNQSGTSSLRAIFYMDEIFGYFPPTAKPPSKTPMLTLLKQARAYGLGVVLATQNPVDLDYKGLSNCGTWLIGRLQTERDKMRVIEGLESALPGASGFDGATLDKMMSSLTQRVFLVRNVHDDAPFLMKSRWALSYLRGPLTGQEIARVMAPRKAAEANKPAAAAAAPPAATATNGAGVRPAVSAGVSEYFLAASKGDGMVSYKPMIAGFAKLHFVDSKINVDQWLTQGYLAALDDEGKQPQWADSTARADFRSLLGRNPVSNVAYASLAGAATRAASYAAWAKALSAHLYENARSQQLVCDALKMSSNPGESAGDFRGRLALLLREQRDAAVEDLRRRYAPKLATLQDRIRTAQDRTEREKDQLKSQRLNTALSVGASILGAVFGSRRITAGNIGRVTSAARTAGRLGREKDDVDRAEDSLEVLQQRLDALKSEFESETARLAQSLDASGITLRTVQLTPRKSDIAIGEVALVWAPWRQGADGFPAPAFD